LVRGLKRTTGESIKASLQRRNYRQAVKQAAMMIFNSEYMRSAYRKNAGCREKASAVVYQALDEETHAAAEVARDQVKKRDLQVLSVSAWGNHKGAETLVEALALLRTQHQVPATLVLAGSWPDKAYERQVRELIRNHGLDHVVDIRGHVSREGLHRLYAESRVFSLMSHCESFGIPAVEAQAFGTPVISSNCCAIPEICGAGGLFPEPGDALKTAGSLASLICDGKKWERLAAAAVENASRYRWDNCSRRLLSMFEVLQEKGPTDFSQNEAPRTN
jgi:glycosyltransferase involved in cell wall biosynthesis